MLRISEIDAGYRRSAVLRSVSLEVGPGEAVAVLGPNGAGKTTLVNVITGTLRPTAGSVEFDGRLLRSLRPWQRAELGIALVPEGRRIIPGLSVVDNLRIGAHVVRDRRKVSELLDDVFAMFPVLAEKRHQDGTTLSGGQQQMLAIGRALMSRPRLLLLDEPSLGLAPVIRQQLATVIAGLGSLTPPVSILMIEQELAMAMSVTSRYYLLRNGSVAQQGISSESAADDLRAGYMR